MLRYSKVTIFLRTVLDKDASFEILSKDKIQLDRNQQTAYFVKICYADKTDYCTVILFKYQEMYILNGLIFNAERENATRYFELTQQKGIQRKNFQRDDEKGQLYQSFLGRYKPIAD